MSGAGRLLFITLSAALLAYSNAQFNFISIGNWGLASPSQAIIASSLKSVASTKKATLVVSPGSNFLSGGVKSLNDPRWITDFLLPFGGSEMNVRFFTVLGSDDWAGNYTAQIIKSENVLQDNLNATILSPRWTLPNYWYRYQVTFPDASSATPFFSSPSVTIGFVFIDTFILSEEFKYQNITTQHWNSFQDTATAYSRLFDWVFVVGDKSIFSSGASKTDKYLAEKISGYDYDLEMIEDGPLLHINCGSGAIADSNKMREKEKHSISFQPHEGFCTHNVTYDKFCTNLYDGINGSVLASYCKGRSDRSKASFSERMGLVSKSGSMPEPVFIPALGTGTTPGEGGIPMPERDIFVRVVGTMGFCALTFLMLLMCVVCGSRIAKVASGSSA